MARYITVTDTAKLIRKALKHNFPGHKFSVRSESYSGGASINVSWTDGPVEADVKPVVGAFAGATFDGMIDLKTSHTSVISNEDGTVEEVRFAADYVFTRRDFSDEAKAVIIGLVDEKYGGPFSYDRRYGDGWTHKTGWHVFGEAAGGLSFLAPAKKARKAKAKAA